jgi:hypothetical protein
MKPNGGAAMKATPIQDNKTFPDATPIQTGKIAPKATPIQ